MSNVALLAIDASRMAEEAEFRLGRTWYRSLPLSSVDLEISVYDPYEPGERIRLCLHDRDYQPDELHERLEESWLALDPERVPAAGIAPGTHEGRRRPGASHPVPVRRGDGSDPRAEATARSTVVVPAEPRA